MLYTIFTNYSYTFRKKNLCSLKIKIDKFIDAWIVQKKKKKNTTLAYCSRSPQSIGWISTKSLKIAQKDSAVCTFTSRWQCLFLQKQFSFRLTFTYWPKLSNFIELRRVGREINIAVAVLVNLFSDISILVNRRIVHNNVAALQSPLLIQISRAFAMKL
jgi:hypothetical protein